LKNDGIQFLQFILYYYFNNMSQCTLNNIDLQSHGRPTNDGRYIHSSSTSLRHLYDGPHNYGNQYTYKLQGHLYGKDNSLYDEAGRKLTPHRMWEPLSRINPRELHKYNKVWDPKTKKEVVKHIKPIALDHRNKDVTSAKEVWTYSKEDKGHFYPILRESYL
jgi:hypothetical protein